MEIKIDPTKMVLPWCPTCGEAWKWIKPASNHEHALDVQFIKIGTLGAAARGIVDLISVPPQWINP